MTLRLSNGAAGFGNLMTCGSVWVCPVCSAKVMASRAQDVGAAVAAWQARGGAVGFFTLTMRHHKGQSLADLWDALGKAWAKVTSGKAWISDRARHGVVGWLKVVEVTWGANGWHVHVHALAFLAPGGAHDVDALSASMFGRWSRSLVRSGLAVPLRSGQHARLVAGPGDALADYFTKAADPAHAVGLEMTHSQSKQARRSHGTVTPWALLDRVQQDGDADALDLWHEYERASHGRRQMTWSRGIRDLLGLGVERTDDEIAEEEIGTADDTLLVIRPRPWARLCRIPDAHAQVLDAVEAAGLDGATALLDAWRIPWERWRIGSDGGPL